jgi:zinc transport system substrate-binding protein
MNGGAIGISSFILFLYSAVIAQVPVQVTVSILPQKYFVEKIGGAAVTVEVMVPPGAEPHTYEPKPKQLVKLSQSKAYFAIGINFEDTWLEKFSAANRKMLIVRTDAGIDKRVMEQYLFEFANEKAHQEEHDRPGSKDAHIWLSPRLVILQARTILDALVKIDPAHQDQYETNYNAFIADVKTLDNQLTDYFKDSSSTGKEFIVFHPAWGYFARDYGLRQIPVEIEGKEPKPADLIKLINYARRVGIKVIFVQPQIFPKSARMIAQEIGGTIIIADPLSEDWYNNLKRVAEQFKTVLKGRSFSR